MKYGMDNLISDSKVVLEKISKTANTAFDVSKAYVEKTQLKVKLREKYYELGKTCYDMHETDIDTRGEMKKLIAEIKMLETEIMCAEEATGKPKVCRFCGAKNSADNNFCSGCGERL